MREITKNLFESLNESTSGMTIKEYADEFLGGEIDNDVTDTEVDMTVAFSFNFNQAPQDNYDEFMMTLGQRTKIVKVNDSEYGATLVCDFSSVFKPYNEKLKEFFNMDNSEFNEDEAYYEAVVNLEPLIAGNAGESTYKELLEILGSEVMNESVDEDSEPYTVTGIAHVIDWYGNEGTIEMEPYNILEITPENICQGANDNGFGVKEIIGIDAYINGEEYNYSGDEFKKYSQGKEQIGIQIPKVDLGEINNIEYYALYTLDETYPVIKVNDKFLITRQGTNDFSGQWRLEGFIEANKYNYKWMISPVEALSISDWKYKNGNPKYKVVDYDHGSSRRWSGEGTGNRPYGFSSIDIDGFRRIIGNEDSIKIEDKTYTLKSSVNESVNIKESAKMNMVKYKTDGYTEATDGYYKGKPIVNYKEKDFKKGTSVLMPFICNNCYNEFYIKSSIHDFFEQGDFDDPYETPSDDLRCPKCKERDLEYNGEVLIKEPGVKINESEDLSIYTDFSNFPNEVAKGETPEERKNILYRCYVSNPKEDEMNKWTIKDLVEYIKETDEYYNKDYKYIFKCCLLCGLTKEEAKELCGERLNESAVDDAAARIKQAGEDISNIDKNTGIRKKQLVNNIEYIVNSLVNLIETGDEEPLKSYDTLVDYVYSQLFDIKDDGKGTTAYHKGVCNDLKYLGKDYIVKEIKRIGNEAGVMNTNLTESVDEGSLAKFIKDSVKTLQNSDYTNCKYNLDDKYAVFVGWSDGYEAEETNEYEIHSKENPTYCINAAIGIRNDADWADFDSIKRPYYEAGDVFEGEWTVSPHEDYTYLANSILKTYSYMLDLIESGELLTEDASIDNDPDLNREQVNADVDYWTDVDEANTEDVSGREPVGVYTISNTHVIYVYDIKHDIDDMVLAGDSSDTTKAKWRYINYEDLTDEETGESIPFFYYGDIKVPLNEVVRTNI